MTDAEFIAWLRFFLGDIDENVISDTNLQIILDIVQAQYPTESECRIKYEFAVAVLEWLIRSQAKGSASSAGSGAISKIREKIGKREKEVTYDVGTSTGTSTGWDKTLEDLKADPNSVGCTVFPAGSGTSTSGSVVIGGGDMYSDPYTSKRKRDEAAYNSRCTNPWRPRR